MCSAGMEVKSTHPMVCLLGLAIDMTFGAIILDIYICVGDVNTRIKFRFMVVSDAHSTFCYIMLETVCLLVLLFVQRN